MLYFNELNNKVYGSEAECRKAEDKIKQAQKKVAEEERLKKEARAKRAKEVEDALKVANEAQAKAIKLLKDFTKEYGYFHTSYTIEDTEKKDASSFFDLLADFLG